MAYRPISHRKQQLGGLLILLMGGGGWAWGWYTGLVEGYYYRKATMLFPAFCILGLGLILFPGYKEERLARGEDISGLSGTQLLTPRWWVVLVVSLLAGGVNFLLMSTM